LSSSFPQLSKVAYSVASSIPSLFSSYLEIPSSQST
jgi:hypothetical protein